MTEEERHKDRAHDVKLVLTKLMCGIYMASKSDNYRLAAAAGNGPESSASDSNKLGIGIMIAEIKLYLQYSGYLITSCATVMLDLF
ncbi:hypothetical protein CEXT_462621 [Caerostris extrusa]|uniref:Uncharacterized protein n=1 Tax=Caerostris extrusa TaxID=172846 RepID=A0AAV4YD64_CAEEX|nr:hypothetical protein CEXT_462621 [Caerostris extrusa]